MSEGFLPSTLSPLMLSSWSPTSITPHAWAGAPATTSCTCGLRYVTLNHRASVAAASIVPRFRGRVARRHGHSQSTGR